MVFGYGGGEGGTLVTAGIRVGGRGNRCLWEEVEDDDS